MKLSAGFDFDALQELRQRLGSSDAIFARAIKSGLSSAAFHVKTALASAVANNELGWKPLRSYSGSGTGSFLSATISKNVAGKKSVKKKIATSQLMTPWMMTHRKGSGLARGRRFGKLFGSLQEILRYSYDPSKLRASVGILPEWSGDKSAREARLFQEGKPNWGKQDVTAQMRKLFAATGMPLKKSTTRLSAPERELFGPVFEKEVASIRRLVFTVIADKLTKGFAHRDILDNTFFGGAS